MALRLTLLAALSALLATSGWTADPTALPWHTEDVAVLIAAALGTDSLRLRR